MKDYNWQEYTHSTGVRRKELTMDELFEALRTIATPIPRFIVSKAFAKHPDKIIWVGSVYVMGELAYERFLQTVPRDRPPNPYLRDTLIEALAGIRIEHIDDPQEILDILVAAAPEAKKPG